MKEAITIVIRVIWGLGAGNLIAGGIVAFITIIGIIPIMAHRSGTVKHACFYEHAIMLGSIIGTIFSVFTIEFIIPKWCICIVGFSFGMFNGALIIALAEVLDAFPIIDRRIKLKKGITVIAIAFALGKLVGGLYYYIYPISMELIN